MSVSTISMAQAGLSSAPTSTARPPRTSRAGRFRSLQMAAGSLSGPTATTTPANTPAMSVSTSSMAQLDSARCRHRRRGRCGPARAFRFRSLQMAAGSLSGPTATTTPAMMPAMSVSTNSVVEAGLSSAPTSTARPLATGRAASVSLSSDGSRVAIGARGNDGAGSDAGHVCIYEFDGASWTQFGADIDGEAAGDWSGWSVSLSSDGSRVAMGPPKTMAPAMVPAMSVSTKPYSQSSFSASSWSER